MSPRGCAESLWVCEVGGVRTGRAGVHVTRMEGTWMCRNVYMRACMGSGAVTSAGNDISGSTCLGPWECHQDSGPADLQGVRVRLGLWVCVRV